METDTVIATALAMEDLPPYRGLTLAEIVVIDSPEVMAEALTALLAADVLGFDTESQPTFDKGQVSTGPHLIQLATDSRAYLFQVARLPDLEGVKVVLESPDILKVGFGLESDRSRLRARLGIAPRRLLDLARALRSEAQKNTVGAKAAAAQFLGGKLQKSRKTATSNWANPQLSERQLLYAADDAQVALRVYRSALASRPELGTFVF
ncbi:MAG TPA: 3'-5' exonuclease [Rhodocyclaceae bacterium]|nr:3'-5' exonuclease [Rhodocyclaceae bacterium]